MSFFWNLQRHFRIAENLPPRRHRTGELMEEMLDTAFAAAPPDQDRRYSVS
jgi:hypothetical protein